MLADKNMSVFQLFEKGVKQKMRGMGAAGFMETAEQKYVQERIIIVAHEEWHEITHKYNVN